jgi:ABC-type sugar transport system ATPase subunit
MNEATNVYKDGFEAVHQLSLDVAEGDLMVMIGPSGCGKTTALHTVAGLTDITGDRVTVLRTGHLQPLDKPQVLYERPDHLFVAAFIGSPAMNLYRATVDVELRPEHLAIWD